MKPTLIGLVILAAIASTGCSATRTDSTALYSTTWELEYLSGPRIAFDKLFPDKKPFLDFEEAENQVLGNSGCNGYTAPFTLDGSSITFGEPGPSTLMYCGEGEAFFRNTIQKVNAWSIDDGKLNLMIDDVSMMRFNEKTTE